MGRTPNFSSKAASKSPGSFSAPVTTRFKLPNSSRVQRRRYDRRKVGVETMIVVLWSLAQLADHLGVQRAEVIGPLDPRPQHGPQAHGKAHRMEQRQNAAQRVVRAELKNLFDGRHVGADVVVAEHHALGLAGRAGGVDDREQVVELDSVQAQPALEHDRGHQVRSKSGGELVGQRHLCSKSSR